VEINSLFREIVHNIFLHKNWKQYVEYLSFAWNLLPEYRIFMNIIKIAIPFLVALFYVPAQVSAGPLLGPELASFSVLSGAYATYGDSTNFNGNVGAVDYITGRASGARNQYLNTSNVTAGLDQLANAQAALRTMGSSVNLAATQGNITLAPGVYDASAITTAASTTITLNGTGADNEVWVFNIAGGLTTGASSNIILTNTGLGAGVYWNLGSYGTLGASSSFLGNILATGYISEGANANIYCGRALSKSYVSVPYGGTSSSDTCAGTGTWAGSIDGLSGGLDLSDNGMSVASRVSAIPEPRIYALMLAGLCIVVIRSWRARRA